MAEITKITTNNQFHSSNRFPEEIIAVSISPFDKFQLNKFNRIRRYTYLGLRDINSAFMGFGYLSKIIVSLVESILKQNKQAFEIGNVLEYLGYRDKILLQFNFSMPRGAIDEILPVNTIFEQEFDNRESFFFKRINRSYFLNSDDSINERKLNRLKKLLRDLPHKYYFNRFFELLITRYGFESIKNNDDIEDILFLINAGVIKLKDVQLFTFKLNNSFSIKDASSGEQSIILSILGIASKIQDNSLICIDEPEICLHPEWQEKYIEILTQTFENYKNCHFIIATHSPMIISRLPFYNSFILNMESRSVQSAKDFINHSSDFQLVNVFDTPGYKNEYLSRIAINTFAKISKYKKLDSEDKENIRIIEKQSNYLKSDDPVYDLYKTLVELKVMFK
ncbi:AAA family ATPase [Epilithonimonas mollis]|uniref:AAA domain-containing protein, putative AbiEii toxin, Type IV TA system n=1 Tax=Epilithonimonas mollis TaxID=216903 RepID=A0A1M6RGG6_9FLAO|nr:AAA domain-containing protein, putative AbiEii toxin, Type IV TA system [Epilithonimonas mollis]